MLLTVVNFLSLYSISKLLRELFLVENCIKCVFSQFKDIKFASNHSCICWRILFISFLKFIGSGFEIIKFVSSANKTVLLFSFIEYGKSFIYSRKSRGPSTNPWGTPWVILPQSEIEVWWLCAASIKISASPGDTTYHHESDTGNQDSACKW